MTPPATSAARRSRARPRTTPRRRRCPTSPATIPPPPPAPPRPPPPLFPHPPRRARLRDDRHVREATAPGQHRPGGGRFAREGPPDPDRVGGARHAPAALRQPGERLRRVADGLAPVRRRQGTLARVGVLPRQPA